MKIRVGRIVRVDRLRKKRTKLSGTSIYPLSSFNEERRKRSHSVTLPSLETIEEDDDRLVTMSTVFNAARSVVAQQKKGRAMSLRRKATEEKKR